MGQRFSRSLAPRLRWRRACRPLALLAVGAGSLIATQAWGLDVANQTDWNTAVAAVAAAGANSTVAINITGGFTLTSSLAQLQASAANVTVVITGNGQTIDGASAYQGIQVSGVNGLAVQISSLSIANAKVVGGTGGAGQNGYYNSSLSYGSGGGGGGGLGAGGGLYVGSGAHVTLSAVTFSGDNSTGGVGGAGGNAQNGASSGTGGDGGAGGVLNGGAASVGGGGAGGSGGNSGTQGTVGSAGTNAGDGGGGGGGSGTTNSTSYTANNSGGADSAGGGNGNSGGDGVTNNNGSQGPGADGGFGGAGGGARGGAIYVATGGTLTIDDAPISGSTATGGAGASAGVGQGPSAFNGTNGATGVAAGAGIYLNGVTANIGVTSGSLTYGDTIGGTGLTSGSVTTAINKTGAGTLVLGATNTFVGDVDITAGTLSVAGAGNLGNAGNDIVISDGGTFAVTGTATFGAGRAFKISGASSLDIAGSTTSTILGVISDGLSGAGTLTKIDTGALVLGGANTYSGGTTLTGGVVQVGVATVGTPGAITSSAIGVGTLTFDGGTLRAGGNYTIANAGAVNNAGGTIDANGHAFTYSGAISDGDGANGSLSLLDSVGGGAVIFSGANSYGAATSVGDGVHAVTLKGGAANTFSANSTMTINANAALDIGGFAQTLGALAGSGAVTNSGAGSSTLTIGANGGSATYSGLIADGAGTVALATTGGGTQTLAGANTFSGGVTLNAGVLQVGSGSVGTPGAITSSAIGVGGLTFNGGALQAGGAYTIDNAATIANSSTGVIDANGYAFAYAGAIGGGGALTVANSGVAGSLTLTAAEGYTGATTINSGATLNLSGAGSIAASSGVAVNGAFDISALSAGSSIASLSGSGAVALGANTLTLTNASGAFSGIIGGSGGLTLTSGAQTLTGANTYTGGTTIAGGNLQVGAGGTEGSIVGNVALSSASSRLIFDRSDAVTFGGLISGAGGLRQIGSGTLILPNANSYSGGTQIQTGTVMVGNNQALGTGVVQMTNGATLAFTRGGVNLPNAISLGVLAGTIDTGANTDTVSGVISGANELTKIGSGTLILTANNTYTGPTNINGGLLQVDGSIADSSQLNIADGAHLTGTGSVGMLQFAAGSTFIPGTAGSPGTSTNIAGALAFASGSTYQIYLNPTSSTFAKVGGTATIAGAVAANFQAGSYVSKSYTILSAGGVSGTFGSLTNTNLPSNFTDALSYDASHAYLDLTLAYKAPSYSPLTVNQTQVANTLVNYFNATGGIPTAFGALTAVGLAQADGEAATGAERSSIQLMNQFLPLMLDPFLDGRWGSGGASGAPARGYASDGATSLPADARAYTAMVSRTASLSTVPQRWTAWGSAYGGSNTSSGDATVGSSNVSSQTYGVAAGADYHLSPDSIVGFALGGGGANWGLQSGMGSGDGQTFQAGVYGVTRSGPAYLAGALGFGDNWFTTHRNAVGDELSGNFSGQSYGGRLEAGYRYAALTTLGITPYGALQAQEFVTPAYSETNVTGGGFGLNYGANSASDVRTELGARFDSAQTISGLSLVLRARLAWAHDFVDNPSLNATFQTLPGTSFTVDGAPIRHDSALATIGADLSVSRNLTLLLKFDGDFGAGSQTYAGSGTLRLSW